MFQKDVQTIKEKRNLLSRAPLFKLAVMMSSVADCDAVPVEKNTTDTSQASSIGKK